MKSRTISQLKKEKKCRVLGFDVGKTNPAWSIIDVYAGDKEPILIDAGMAKHKINNFSQKNTISYEKMGNNFNKTRIEFSNFGQVKRFFNQIQELVKKYDVDYAVVERFQNRGFGRTGGEASEFCSLIVGVIASSLVQTKTPYMLIMASRWKTQFNNKANLTQKAGTKTLLDSFYKEATVQNHIVDATLMAIYGGMHLFDKVPFEGFRYNWVVGLLK